MTSAPHGRLPRCYIWALRRCPGRAGASTIPSQGLSLWRAAGNHDTIRMVPGLEEMGIGMLLNECEAISRGDQDIYLAGIDQRADHHRVDNIEKAALKFLIVGFSRSSGRTRRKSTARTDMPGSIYFSAAIRTEDRSASPVGSQSPSIQFCRYAWAPEPGSTMTWLGYTSVGVAPSIVAAQDQLSSGNHAAPPPLRLTAGAANTGDHEPEI